MQLSLKVLAAISLAISCTLAEDKPIKHGKRFGGPHGTPFTDESIIMPGMKPTSVWIRGAERVDAIGMTYKSPSGAKMNWTHGGDGGEPKTMYFEENEYITIVRWFTNKYRGKTRVFYLEFYTNKGHNVARGTKPENEDDIKEEESPAYYQLGAFNGRSGKEIDELEILWTCVKPGCEQFDEGRLGYFDNSLLEEP